MSCPLLTCYPPSDVIHQGRSTGNMPNLQNKSQNELLFCNMTSYCLSLSLSPGSVSQSLSSVRVVTAEMFFPSPSTNHRAPLLTPGNFSFSVITWFGLTSLSLVRQTICLSDDLSVCLMTCLSVSGSPQVLSPSMSGPPNVQPRRSSRLFTSASSTAKVQEHYITQLYNSTER